MNIFDHKVLYVGCERMPGFTSAHISLDLKKFSINILRCIVLQFWWKLNIHTELLKPVHFIFCMIIMVISSMLCFPSFLTISYHFPWCFPMFPIVFLQFPQVFLLLPPFPYCFPWCFPMFPLVFLRFPQVFLLFPLSISPISYFRFCEPKLQMNA